MFSKRVINSARFLTMPLSSQALYFHLGLNADDDGVVEAFMVMRQVGASQDDLRILVAKGFVTLLNDDLVAFIMDWRENNKIRADRKTDSIYLPLLLQILPEVEVLQTKERADLKKIKSGRPVDGQLSDNGRHRIGKDRLGKDSIDKDNNNTTNLSNANDNDNDNDVSYHDSSNVQLGSQGVVVGVVSKPFEFWNKNMGLMTEYISEKIQDMIADYGEVVVLEAMQRSLEQGKRTLAYVEGCCKNIHSGADKPKKEELLF